MDPSRLLPALLAALLLVPTLSPVSAQQGPSLRLPGEARDLQSVWINNATRDTQRFLAQNDVPDHTEQRLKETLNRTNEAYSNEEWGQVIDQLVGLRALLAFIPLDQQARQSDEPDQVYLDAMDPAYRNATDESIAVRNRLNQSQHDVETTKGLEYLYLGARSLVTANQQLNRYPETRQQVVDSGNETPRPTYQRLVANAVAGRWNARYAFDVIEMAETADEEAEGPPVDPSKVDLAWDRMEAEVDERGVNTPQTNPLRDASNKAQAQGQWLMATALGERIVVGSLQHRLTQLLRDDSLNTTRLREDLGTMATNTSLLERMEDHGFASVGLKDAKKRAFAAAAGEAGPRGLISTFALVQAQEAASEGLLEVANASAQAAEEDGAGLVGGLLWAGGGAVVGVGAAYAVLRRRGIA